MSSDLKKINEKARESFLDFKGLIKHVARCKLWLPEAIKLKEERGRPLKYFTLPGKLAWDIHLFEQYGIIRKVGRGFPDVRFCDNNRRFYTEATKLLGNTVGAMSNFEDLVLKDNKVFWSLFPYDIYNLDFCGTCFPDKQPPFSNTFKSIQKIIRHHRNDGDLPFNIFLTLKVVRRETKEESILLLKDNIEANRNINKYKVAIDSFIPSINQFINNSFTNFIVCSIPKLICKMAKSYCNVEITSRTIYQRNPRNKPSYYIAKFVFKFTKPTVDFTNTMNYDNNIIEIMKEENISEFTNRDISLNS